MFLIKCSIAVNDNSQEPIMCNSVYLKKQDTELYIHCLQIPSEPLVEMSWKKWHLRTHSVQFSSVQSSHSVVSDSLRPHELQHARPPCPSPTPGAHPDPCPWSQWCHPAISSSVIPFSCPQSLPASEPFPMSQLFAWGGQSTGVSALASFLPKKFQVLFIAAKHFHFFSYLVRIIFLILKTCLREVVF